jgi:hypothetical protein
MLLFIFTHDFDFTNLATACSVISPLEIAIFSQLALSSLDNIESE